MQFPSDMLISTTNVFTTVGITITKLKFLGSKTNFKYRSTLISNISMEMSN